MISIKDIITYCELTNTSYEVHGSATYLPRYEKGAINRTKTTETDHSLKIGFKFKDHVWYWFSALTLNTSDLADPMVSFEHRYNQNNGASRKGWRTGFACETKIEKTLANR